MLLTRTNFGRVFSATRFVRRAEKLLPNMMQQERRQQPGTLSEQRRQMPALLHNIKAAINNHPCLLAYSRVFKEEEKKERENRMQSFTCARPARVWTSSNLRHLHSCRRQGSTQECEKVGSQEVEAKHKHTVHRTNLQPRNNSAFIYSYIQPLRAGGGRHGSSSGIRRNGNWRSGAPFE